MSMKQYVVSPDADKAQVILELTKAANNYMNSLPLRMYNKQRQEHLLKRMEVFLGMVKELVAASSKSMPLSVQYNGDSFYAASYIEVQLVDKKNTIVYAAVVLDDN